MANADFTRSTLEVLEYKCLPWGDLIYGTKEQLQSLGIGIDVQFPSDPDRPFRSVKVKDPRGFDTRIQLSTYMGEGIYSASISFPGRSSPKAEWLPFALGVKISRDCWWYDEFIGTAEALYAAGLAELDQFPGQPGMGKVQVTLSPDGRLDSSTNGHKRRQPGQVMIKRASKSHYTVRVLISDEEAEIRQDANKRADRAWEAKMAALPRPAPLTVMSVRSFIQEKLEIKHTNAKQDKGFQAFLSGLTQYRRGFL